MKSTLTCANATGMKAKPVKANDAAEPVNEIQAPTIDRMGQALNTSLKNLQDIAYRLELLDERLNGPRISNGEELCAPPVNGKLDEVWSIIVGLQYVASRLGNVAIHLDEVG